MFAQCLLLNKLNISNFNFNNVTNLNGMFFKCISLKDLNISNFNFIDEEEINEIFNGCSDELILEICKKFHCLDDDLDYDYLNINK